MPNDLPPGQQLAAPGKWPTVGERLPSETSEPWTLTVQGRVGNPSRWTLDELNSLPQVRPVVDIHCVTRWSKMNVPFQGVALATLLDQAEPSGDARFLSFVARSPRRHSTSLQLEDAIALGAFIALAAEGEPLPVSRGGPIRLVTPGRYFYKSVKWLEAIDVLEHDRLGYWEAEAGYHNTADPALEQRYIAAKLTKRETAQLLVGRDFSDRDLLGVEASGRELNGLTARCALLRNADFRDCELRAADFRGANLADAHLQGADLREASFVDADVEGANFCGAQLQAADFRGASLFGATFFEATIEGSSALMDAETAFDFEHLDALAPEQQRFIRQARERSGR